MQRHKVKEWSSGQQGKGVRFQPLCVIYTFFGRLTSLTHNLLSVHQSDAGESSLVFAQQVWLCSQGKGLVSFLKRIVIKHVEWFVNSKSEIWNQWCWIIRSQFLWDKQHRTNLVWWAKKKGIGFWAFGKRFKLSFKGVLQSSCDEGFFSISLSFFLSRTDDFTFWR